MKSGIVYSRETEAEEVNIAQAVKILKSLATILRWTGLGCIALAGMGMAFIYMPLGWAELNYAWGKTLAGREITRVNRNIAISRTEEQKPPIAVVEAKPEWAVPDESYSIYIPKIEAISKVIPGVSVENKEDYMAALQKGVAEAAGLAHPGEIGTTYLFAHSVGNRIDYARYNAVFYLLDKLEMGDRIEIMYNRKLYVYKVWNREILEPNDVRYLLPQNNEEKLVLQTCYPPGTTWKRLEVTAKRI